MDFHDVLLILRVCLVSSNLPAKTGKPTFTPESLRFLFPREAFFTFRAKTGKPRLVHQYKKEKSPCLTALLSSSFITVTIRSNRR
jgi:hypothetical protein